MQQRQLLDFLVRGEQIALHAVGKKLQGALAFFACGDALPLRRQALRNPLRQGIALHRFHLNGHALGFQRGEPAAGFCHPVQARQHHQRQCAVIALG